MVTTLTANSKEAAADQSPLQREMLSDYANGKAPAQEFLTI